MFDKNSRYNIFSVYRGEDDEEDSLVVYQDEESFREDYQSEYELDITQFIPITDITKGMLLMLYPQIDIATVGALLDKWRDYYDKYHEYLDDRLYIIKERGIR